jgi:UDP-galactopyranose mutase
MLDDIDLLVCGAGPVGCVVAERAAHLLGWKVLIVDRRSHIAGNCFDSPHKNGVLVHRYGPHYFRTNDEDLVRYLGRFTEWLPGNYEVKALYRGRLFPFPINLDTLEQFFGRRLDAGAAERLLAEVRLPVSSSRNSEEFVLGQVGRELYEAFYLNYTLKQWNIHPRDLDPSVCGRVGVRLDRDHRYVRHRFQMMPKRGYTPMFARMIDHPRIRVLLGCDFNEVRGLIRPRRATVYSGPIDDYFDCRLGKLPYRSLRFELRTYATPYRQPCVQINYPNDFSYTRSVEFKHVTAQKHPETVISYETPDSSGEPFYPVPTAASAALFQRYQELAQEETRLHRVFFRGRLAQYRYFNTDEVIQEALQCFDQICRGCVPGQAPFVWSSTTSPARRDAKPLAATIG